MKQRRTTALFTITSLIFAVLVGRLTGLQLISGQKYRRLAKENYVKPIIIEAPRGIIYSREGKVLADNVPAYTVTIDTLKVMAEEREKLLELLFTESCGGDTAQETGGGGEAKLTLNNNIPKRIPFEVVCQIEERKEEFPNVQVSAHPLRRYPYGEIFSHLIGYASEISKEEIVRFAADPSHRVPFPEQGRDVGRGQLDKPGYRLGANIGKSGVERQYETYLRGKDGTRYVEVDAKGREQGLLSSVPPEPGSDVWLNIDAELQEFAYEIMPSRGACVAMNPTNGEILLWVSKPGYQSNLLAKGISSDTWNKWVEDSLSPLWDRVEKGSFPPASIFKLITCAAALEQELVTPETHQLVSCVGSIQIGGRKFDCWATHGSLNLIDAIIQSCDVYFYQLGLQLGVEAITVQAKKVGFGVRTGVDLPGEVAGFIPSENWYERKYGKGGWGKGVSANIAVGQGEILVTPLQILYFVSGIANRGVLCTPRIAQKVVSPGGEEIFTNTPSFTHIPWKEKTIEVLRKGMLGVVQAPNGTGRLSQVPGIEVAGKTGTAQNPTGETHAWFVAFAPYEAPQICIVVFVEHGGMGGSVAAPIAGRILKKYFGIEENRIHSS